MGNNDLLQSQQIVPKVLYSININVHSFSILNSFVVIMVSNRPLSDNRIDRLEIGSLGMLCECASESAWYRFLINILKESNVVKC